MHVVHGEMKNFISNCRKIMEGEGEGEGAIWKCCDKTFTSEAAYYGHKTHHGKRKKKGAKHHFVQQPYKNDPGKLSRIRNEPIPLKRFKRGARYFPPIYEPFLMVPGPIRKEEPDTRSEASTSQPVPGPSAKKTEEEEKASTSKSSIRKEPRLSIMKTLSEWIKSEDSPYNVELLEWFSKLPFKTPNEDVDNKYIKIFQDVDKNMGVNCRIVDVYLYMIESNYHGLNVLPFIDRDIAEKDILEKFGDFPDPNVKMLLVNMSHRVSDEVGHAYLGVVDFEEMTISYYDFEVNLKDLNAEKEKKMKLVMAIAKKMKQGEYKEIYGKINKEVDENNANDCAFYTCLFAKTIVLEQDFELMEKPCRKKIIYEILKGDFVD